MAVPLPTNDTIWHPRVQLVAGGAFLCFLYFLSTVIYKLYFHPLAGVPGPRLHAISKLPYLLSLVRGYQARDMATLHDKYGEIVRVAPNQLSFTHAHARKEMFGYRNGQKHFTKDPANYIEPPNGARSIHSILDDAGHARQRRLLAHAFSEKALQEQEPLLRSYVDLLIRLLHEQVEGPNKGRVDMVRWLNYTTFDLIGDLTFGEPFNCLAEGRYHPWIEIIFGWMRGSVFMSAVSQYPLLSRILMALLPKKVMQMRQDHFNLSASKMDRRLETVTDRPDFVTYLQKHNASNAMSIQELHSNSEILILAGSETTATALSGCLYYLCLNPEVMRRLTTEIRTAMKTEDEIVFANILELKYMAAVLNETMRIYPPVPGDMPRIAPEGGAMIVGHWVPGGTGTSINGWAIAHSYSNFCDPYTFDPDRWLDDDSGKGKYANDKLEASQPFSFGPRNCIGKNLAYAEMRLILSKLLWNFDVKLCEESQGWEKQRCFMLWEKHPLMLRLTKVR